jgi:hypothetical protein
LRLRRTAGRCSTSSGFKVLATPRTYADVARRFLRFEGSFECEVTDTGTVVTHREAFDFNRPWRWIAEPLLRRWLESDTVEEMVRFKELGGQRPSPS